MVDFAMPFNFNPSSFKVRTPAWMMLRIGWTNIPASAQFLGAKQPNICP
jgi:hypothetical protein